MEAFDAKEYAKTVETAVERLKSIFPKDFSPQIALTLGSGLNGILNDIQLVADPIPYDKIPGFLPTTAPGHEGKLLAGYLEKVPVMVFQGRKHYYELVGIRENPLRDIVFPLYVARGLGSNTYIATNAAGGVNTSYHPADLMLITSHFGLFMQNPLLGPVVPLFNSQRFTPQNNEYDPKLLELFKKSAKSLKIESYIHEGVYAMVGGPSFETAAEIRMLRILGVDAVGMSTVPEIIAATSIGMKTMGISLITNVTNKDGTNATTSEEVLATLENPITKKRVQDIFQKFFHLYSTASEVV